MKISNEKHHEKFQFSLSIVDVKFLNENEHD